MCPRGIAPGGADSGVPVRIVPLASVTAVLVLASLIFRPLSAAAAANPVRCGDTIAEGATVTLSANLYCAGGTGLHLMPHSVLNLGGHALIGPGRLVAGSTGIDTPDIFDADGIQRANDHQAVRNGQIKNWSSGIHTGSPDGDITEGIDTISAVTFKNNETAVAGEYKGGPQATVKGSRFESNGLALSITRSNPTVSNTVFVKNGTGVFEGYFTLATYTGTQFSNNGTGLACDGGDVSGRADVTNSVIAGNTVGIDTLNCRIKISGSRISRNGTGYRSLGAGATQDSQVNGNTFTANTVAVDANAGTFTGNVFKKNGTGFTTTDTDWVEVFQLSVTLTANQFLRNGNGIYSEMNPLSLEANIARHNVHYGIYAPNATDHSGNKASANGTSPQCTGAVCTP